eukprot:CAMPEP_0185017082 /NCGR_PEP_ID=MMETSP1103-20130426/43_1 /TAXON_ID=36769 /ORGANISM="Paraphysomonas bandaiensis, Strain Caron Lab Isolate" /LENGTH=33 /DNA_ID= /DNA_START= /DNA_END= /DNA_ORIENTATION=
MRSSTAVDSGHIFTGGLPFLKFHEQEWHMGVMG